MRSILLRPWTLTALLACIPAAAALGQTTQPAPAEWGEKIANLVKNLTDEPDDTRAQDALAPDQVVIQRFGSSISSGADTLIQLRQKTNGLSVIAARVYVWPAETVASDLASDAKACQPLPDGIRRQFVPRNDAETKRANAAAQQWVNNFLHPNNGELIAVMLLWEPPPSITTRLLSGGDALSEAAVKPPVFVLVKGQQSQQDGQIHLLHITYGDSKQALN